MKKSKTMELDKELNGCEIEVTNIIENTDGSATLELNLSDRVEKLFKKCAKKNNMTIEDYVLKMIKDYIECEEVLHQNKMDSIEKGLA